MEEGLSVHFSEKFLKFPFEFDLYLWVWFTILVKPALKNNWMLPQFEWLRYSGIFDCIGKLANLTLSWKCSGVDICTGGFFLPSTHSPWLPRFKVNIVVEQNIDQCPCFLVLEHHKLVCVWCNICQTYVKREAKIFSFVLLHVLFTVVILYKF